MMGTNNIYITSFEVEDVLKLISEKYGYDFRNYAKASMQRRVQRFIEDANFKSVNDLKYQLLNNAATFDFFLQRITVNVTEMFRDPDFYKEIKEKVLPVLASYPLIKIWHAGCSSGEEVFSIAIMLHEAGLLERSKIYATDINPLNLEKAQKGIMPLEVMKDYTANYLKSGGTAEFSSYYTAMYNHVLIRKDLRNNIIFSQHNLVTDGVFNQFQLVLCRNVMIYFNRFLQNRVINLFHDSLSNFGFLGLGLKESMLFTDVRSKFETVSNTKKIFRRIK